MKKRQISRRGVLKGSLMASVIGGTGSFFGPWKENRVWAQGAAKPIKLGLTCDASGQYGNSGQDDLRGIQMAIDEFNAKGGVLGRKITWITADTETTPATGSRIAERFITREDCTILIGALHSGVANAITQVASKYGVIYLNTNSSAPSEAGENCSRVKFVWDGNGTNFSKASVKNAVDSIGKNWMLLTNDYVWGHTTSAATKGLVEGSGGKIIDNLLVPQNTRDFTAYLLKIQQAKPDVVATAIGGDDIKALREQVAQLKLDGKPAWINNQQDWPDVWGAPDSLFGVFGTTWYHKLPLPGVAEFVKKWQATNKEGGIPVPGNVSYNGYMATRELLRAIERAGSTNNIKIIKELENLKMSATDRMQHFDAYMDPVTHQMQQTIYLARRNTKPTDKTDLFEIISWTEPKAAADRRGGEVQARSLRAGADRRLLIATGRAAWPSAVRTLARVRTAVSRIGKTRNNLFDLLPHLLNGLTLGLLFALIALGFMLIVGVMEQINLAHGSLFALGAYFAMQLMGSRPPFPAELAKAWLALPLGWRYAATPGHCAGRGRHRRHRHRTLHAPHLRQGSALRPAADLRRRDGDRGDDPAGLGHPRLRAAGAAGDQRRLPVRRSDLVDLSLLRRPVSRSRSSAWSGC